MTNILFQCFVDLFLLIGSIWCHPLRPDTGLQTEDLTTFHLDYLIVVIGVFLCGITVIMGCLCCQRGGLKGFENVGNSYVQDNFSEVAATSEFTMFPPIHCNLDQNSLVDVKFEPLPDIRLRGSSSGSSQPRPANFSSVINQGLSVQDWFDEPYNNFPRHNLKYLQEVGSGWFGQVVVGEAQGMGQTQKRKVVVKILREDATPTDQIYFLHEVKIFRDLDHPNVMKLLGKCLECDPFLLILEYCPFNDLKTYLVQHRTESSSLIKENLLLRMACNIAAGLLHMHSYGFIHTDLAARNCLVTAELQVKIGDYGNSIEKFKDNYYCAGDVAVPIRWCAPETLRCTDTIIETKEVTKEANSWSFGVLIWEIVEFGKLPYSDLHDEDVLQRVIIQNNVTLPQPQTVYHHAERVYQLMKLCWLKDPKLRINIEKLNALLTHLYSYKDSSDFEERWNILTPTNSRNVCNIGRGPTTLFSLTFEDDFNDIDTSHSLRNTSNGSKNISDSYKENSFFDMNLENAVPISYKDAAFSNLQNSHSITNTVQSSGSVYGSQSDFNDFSLQTLNSNDLKTTNVKQFHNRTGQSTEKVKKEFDAWLISQEAKGAEASLMARQISEAINDLDSALANEKTSSEEDSNKSSPERDFVKDENKVEDVNNLPCSSDDETWNETNEEDKRGSIQISELVREKSHSVQDFLKLTVIDIDNNSDSDTVLTDQIGSFNVATKGIHLDKNELSSNCIKQNNTLNVQKPLSHLLPLSRLECFAMEIVNASVTLAVREIIAQTSYWQAGNLIVEGLGCVSPESNLTSSLVQHFPLNLISTKTEQMTVDSNSNPPVEGKSLSFLSHDALINKTSYSNQFALSQGPELIFNCHLTDSVQKYQIDLPIKLTNQSNDKSILNYRSICRTLNPVKLNAIDVGDFIASGFQESYVFNNQFNLPKNDGVGNDCIIKKTVCTEQNGLSTSTPLRRHFSENDLLTLGRKNSKFNYSFNSVLNLNYCTNNLEIFNPCLPSCLSFSTIIPKGAISHQKRNINDMDFVRNTFQNMESKNCLHNISLNSRVSVDEADTSPYSSSNKKLNLTDVESNDLNIVHALEGDLIETVVINTKSSSDIQQLKNLIVPRNPTNVKIELLSTVLDDDDGPEMNNIFEFITTKNTQIAEKNDLIDLMNKINSFRDENIDTISPVRRIQEEGLCETNGEFNERNFNSNDKISEFQENVKPFNHHLLNENISEHKNSVNGKNKSNSLSDNYCIVNNNKEINDLFNTNAISAVQSDLLSNGIENEKHSQGTKCLNSSSSVASQNLSDIHLNSFGNMTNKKELENVDNLTSNKNEVDENPLFFSLDQNCFENDTPDSLSVGSYERAVTPSIENAFILDPVVFLPSNHHQNDDYESNSSVIDSDQIEKLAHIAEPVKTDNCDKDSGIVHLHSELLKDDVMDLPFLELKGSSKIEDKSLEGKGDSCSSSSSLFDIDDIDEALATLDNEASNELNNQEGHCLFMVNHKPKQQEFINTNENSLLVTLHPLSESVNQYPYLETNNKKELSEKFENGEFEEKVFAPSANDAHNFFPRIHFDGDQRESEQLVVIEDLESLKQSNETFVLDIKNFDVDDDLLIVDTETNEALLVESSRPQTHLAFVQQYDSDINSNKLEDLTVSLHSFKTADDMMDHSFNYDLSPDSKSIPKLLPYYSDVPSLDVSAIDYTITSTNTSSKTSTKPSLLKSDINSLETHFDDETASCLLTADVSELFEQHKVSNNNSETSLLRALTPNAELGFLRPPVSSEKTSPNEWESDSESSSQTSSTSGEFDCSKNSVNSKGKSVTEDSEDDRTDESMVSFKVSSWNKNAIPKCSSLRSPEKKSEIKKSVSFNTPKTLLIYEYPHEEKQWQESPSRQLWGDNIYNPGVDLNNYTDWELGEEEISEDIVEVEDFEEPSHESSYPFLSFSSGSLYQLSNIHCDDDDDDSSNNGNSEDKIVKNYLFDESYGEDTFYSADDEFFTTYNSNLSALQNVQHSPVNSKSNYFYSTYSDPFNANIDAANDIHFIQYSLQESTANSNMEKDFDTRCQSLDSPFESESKSNLTLNKLLGDERDSSNFIELSTMHDEEHLEENQMKMLEMDDVNKNNSPVFSKSLRKWSETGSITDGPITDNMETCDKSKQTFDVNLENHSACTNAVSPRAVHHSHNGDARNKKEETYSFTVSEESNQEVLI